MWREEAGLGKARWTQRGWRGINRSQGGLPSIGGQAPLRAWEFDTVRLGGLTFSRASQATIQNADGTWQAVAQDVLRIGSSGVIIEGPETNRLLNSASLSTQSVSVTAQIYTLTMQGTGSITLSGAATGVLNGTGAANRVGMVFTPSAGTLTLTVSGSVTFAMLRTGSSVAERFTSWVPTGATPATRAADALSLDVSGLDLSGGAWVVLRGTRFGAAVGNFNYMYGLQHINYENSGLINTQSNGLIQSYQFANGNISAIETRTYSIGTNLNMATRFGPDIFAQVWLDGTIVTDTTAPFTTPTSLTIGRLGALDTVTSGSNRTIRGIYIFAPSVTPEQAAAYVTGLS